MGKSKRIRADRAEIDAFEQISKKSEEKKAKRLSIIIICVIVALIAATISLIVISKSGIIARSNVLYESENYKVNEMMFDYLFYNNYNTQYNYYASLISSEYVSYFVNAQSIAETTKSNIKDYLVYCEAARKAGVTLGDFENRKIDEAIESVKETVKSSGYTLGAIYGCDGMNYSDVRDMLEIQYLANKFSKENTEKMTDEIIGDTEKVLKYFEDNKSEIVTGSYVSAEVSEETWKGDLSVVESSEEFIKLFIDLYVDRNFALNNTDDEETEVPEGTEPEDEVTNSEVDEDAETGDDEATEDDGDNDEDEIPEMSEAFVAAIKKTIADMIKYIEYELDIDNVETDKYTASAIKEIYEAKYLVEDEEIDDSVFDWIETAANAIKTNITKVLEVNEGKGYSDKTEVEKWVFAEKEEKENGELFLSAREKDEIFTSEDSDFVVYITEVPTYNNAETKNVGHVLVKVSNSEDENELAKAKEKADNILKEFQGLAQTKENFKAVAEKYTDDSGVFYYNVKSGDMVAEFNDWIFAEDRVVGETGIVKTEYGYHVMFFLGDGVEEWELEALENNDGDGMLDVKLAEWKSGLEAEHPVKVNENAIAKFDESIA